jgi:hypothetical protein
MFLDWHERKRVVDEKSLKKKIKKTEKDAIREIRKDTVQI